MPFIYSYNQTSNLSADELSVKVWATLTKIIFTVSFDQFNASSLLNKITFFK